MRTLAALALATLAVVGPIAPAGSQTPKHGGILNAMQGEDLPAGFSIHDSSIR